MPVGSAVRLQLRAEAFNLLNRTNLDLPDAFFGSPTFGQMLSARQPATDSVRGSSGILNVAKLSPAASFELSARLLLPADATPHS